MKETRVQVRLRTQFWAFVVAVKFAFVAGFCTPPQAPARAGAGGMVMAASAVSNVHSGNGMGNGMQGCACTPRPRLMNAHGKTAHEALVRWPCAVRKVPRRIQRPQNHRTKKVHMRICTQVAPAPVQWPCICICIYMVMQSEKAS